MMCYCTPSIRTPYCHNCASYMRTEIEELKAKLAATPKVEQEPVAIALHYPECWDTACYSTVWDALAEVAASFRCINDDCEFQSTPQIPRPC